MSHRILVRSFLSFLPLFALLGMSTLSSAADAPPTRQIPSSPLSEIKAVEWVQFHAQERAMIDLRPVLSSKSLSLKLRLPGYETDIVRQGTVSFVRLDVPGSGVTPTVGKPELPVVRRFVAIPEGASVTARVKTGRPKVVRDIKVYPVQEPPREAMQGQGPEETFAFDQAFYRRDQKYPAQLATVSKPMKLRDVTVVQIEIAPMRYNPARKALWIYPDIDVDLSFSAPFPSPSAPESPAGDAAESPTGFTISSDKLLVKWDWIKTLFAHLKWDYLVITPDAYREEIMPLAEWKQSKGLSVHVTSLSEIGASPDSEQIHDYIQDAFENHRIEYVLLVGDTDTMPGHMYTGGGHSTITDYYYALVAGDDYLPDIALGRFSVRSETEATNLVQKSDWKRRQ